MAIVRFTRNMQRHVDCPEGEAAGATVREVLEAYFQVHAQARGYVLDDQGQLRHHMAIFINGGQILNRENLSDAVPEGATLDIVQALSGGRI